MIGTEHSPKSTLIKALNNEHKRKITMEIILPEQLVPVKWVLRSKTKRKKSVRLIILNKNTCKILRQIFRSPWRLSNDLIMLQYVVFGKLTNQSDCIFSNDGKQCQRNHLRQLGEEICILGWWLRTHGVQSHKEPLIYLKSIHQFWGILEVEGICKSKQEAACFRQVWHTSDHGLSFYDNPNHVGLMAHVNFQWATAKLSVHLSFITTLLVETKKNQEFGQTNR